MCSSKGYFLYKYTKIGYFIVFRGLLIMKEIYEYAKRKHDFMNAHLNKKKSLMENAIDAFEI